VVLNLLIPKTAVTETTTRCRSCAGRPWPGPVRFCRTKALTS